MQGYSKHVALLLSLVTVLLSACTSPKPLTAMDDALVVSVSLATPSDISRLSEVVYQQRRLSFGRALINVRGECPKKCDDYRFNKKIIEFGPLDFDVYMYYDDLSKMDLLLVNPIMKIFLIKFYAPHLLENFSKIGGLGIFPRYCNTNGPGVGFETESFIWRDRAASDFLAEEMLAASKTDPEAIPFELFMELPESERATDIRDDICVDLIKFSMFSRPRYAKPLEIGQAALQSAIEQ